MLKLIKSQAVNALAVQNKNQMETALKDIVEMCNQGLQAEAMLIEPKVLIKVGDTAICNPITDVDDTDVANIPAPKEPVVKKTAKKAGAK